MRALVRTGADIVAIAERIPADWTNDEARKSDVVYLLDGIDPSQAVAALQPHEDIDSVRLAPGAVLWADAGAAPRSETSTSATRQFRTNTCIMCLTVTRRKSRRPKLWQSSPPARRPQ